MMGLLEYIRGRATRSHNEAVNRDDIEEAWQRFVQYRIYGMGMDYPERIRDKALLKAYYTPPKPLTRGKED